MLELLGEGGEGVTDKNLIQYLGVLEQRTNELLAQYSLLAADGSDAAAGERAADVLTGKRQGEAPLQYVIEQPSTGSGGSGVGPGGVASLTASRSGTGGGTAAAAAGAADDERPLSRGSLAARVSRAVALKTDTAVKIKAVRAARLTGHGGGR